MIIYLTKGLATVIDDIDSDLDAHIWCISSKGYAVRGGYDCERDVQCVIRMHREILERKLGRSLEDGMVTDHINKDKLDNRRNNLREVTHAENRRNREGLRIYNNNTSGFTGVSGNDGNGWRAGIQVNGIVHRLGTYGTKEKAREARRLGELEYLGEY